MGTHGVEQRRGAAAVHHRARCRRAEEAVEVGQDTYAVITADGYEVCDFEGNPAQGKPFTVEWDVTAAEKGGA